MNPGIPMQSAFTARDRLVLIVVLAGALGLRLLGVQYGLPFLFITDEYHEVMRAMQLGSGSFNFGRTGKGGLYLLLFVEYGVYFLILKLQGVVDTAMDFARQFTRDPSAFYLMGRVTVALFGTWTVLLIALASREAFSRRAGILAALFLSVNILHAHLSRVAVVDVVMTCFLTGALLFAFKIANRGLPRDYLWAAVFAALATTTKIPAILLVVPLIIAHVYNIRRTGGGLGGMLRYRAFWIAVAVFAAILISTNPGIVPGIGNYVGLFVGDEGASAALLDEEYVAPTVERPNLFLYYFLALQESMGWPLFVVCLAGLGYGLWRRTSADVLLASFGLLFYLAIAGTSSDHLYYTRYALPVVAVLIMLGGRLIDLAWRSSSAPGRVAIALATGLVAALPLYETAVRGWVLTQADTRALARDWIDKNLPQGSRIYIEGAKIAPVRSTVPLQDSAENIKRRIEYWKVAEPRQAEFLKLRLQVLEGATFNLELAPLTGTEPLAAYRNKAVNYFVIVPDRYLQSRNSNVNSARLLKELRGADDVALIKRFDADPRRPGPTIEIYGLEPVATDGAS
ncbi:MAG: ArnT family glycosyltransferase [Steroidobacteraceae bacterium]